MNTKCEPLPFGDAPLFGDQLRAVGDPIVPGRWAFAPLPNGPLEPEGPLDGVMAVLESDSFEQYRASTLAAAKSGDAVAMDKVVNDKNFSNGFHHIRTRSGILVDPWNLSVADINEEDICFGLSNEARYAGQVPFYSVAQHSVMVASYFTTPLDRLAALLHDAEEAYLLDMPSPIKARPEMAEYKAACIRARKVIFDAFGIAGHYDTLYPKIKVIDDLVYTREREMFKKGLTGVMPGRAYALYKHELKRTHDEFMAEVLKNVP